MKIGVIYVAWQSSDYIDLSLQPWVKSRARKLTGDEYVICGVSVPFVGFPQEDELDDTLQKMNDYNRAGEIDKLITSDHPLTEIEARGRALKYLVNSAKCDLIIQVDSDEFYDLAQIQRIFIFVKNQEFVSAFRLSLKNYVFNNRTYLKDPFTPMRIHRVKVKDFTAEKFYADNNIQYGSLEWTQQDIQFPTMTISSSVAWIKHLTWQNDLRSKRKIEYQLNGRGWPSCSFAWDENRGGLVFNPELPPPTILTE